jgi:hypothetical protein
VNDPEGGLIDDRQFEGVAVGFSPPAHDGRGDEADSEAV